MFIVYNIPWYNYQLFIHFYHLYIIINLLYKYVIVFIKNIKDTRNKI